MMRMTPENYAREMIPHHEVAIGMSRQLLDVESSGEMAEFAKRVIKAQSAEIQQLKRWLNREDQR